MSKIAASRSDALISATSLTIENDISPAVIVCVSLTAKPLSGLPVTSKITSSVHPVLVSPFVLGRCGTENVGQLNVGRSTYHASISILKALLSQASGDGLLVTTLFTCRAERPSICCRSPVSVYVAVKVTVPPRFAPDGGAFGGIGWGISPPPFNRETLYFFDLFVNVISRLRSHWRMVVMTIFFTPIGVFISRRISVIIRGPLIRIFVSGSLVGSIASPVCGFFIGPGIPGTFIRAFCLIRRSL